MHCRNIWQMYLSPTSNHMKWLSCNQRHSFGSSMIQGHWLPRSSCLSASRSPGWTFDQCKDQSYILIQYRIVFQNIGSMCKHLLQWLCNQHRSSKKLNCQRQLGKWNLWWSQHSWFLIHIACHHYIVHQQEQNIVFDIDLQCNTTMEHKGWLRNFHQLQQH